MSTEAITLPNTATQSNLLTLIAAFLVRTFGRGPVETHDDGVWTSGARGL
jgi:hypothetical protein